MIKIRADTRYSRSLAEALTPSIPISIQSSHVLIGLALGLRKLCKKDKINPTPNPSKIADINVKTTAKIAI